MSRLRHNQQVFKQGIYQAWREGARCVVGVMATGGGKTVTMADMVRELPARRGVIEAHRSELVGQISQALAREGIRHNITAAKSTIKAIVENHMDELKTNFYDPRATWNVASVDTILRRGDPHAPDTDYLFQDEGHHTLMENKWGKCAGLYPERTRVLLMTATPCRADGKGLGSHHDGIADAMVVGPQQWELIRDGYLTRYDVYTPTAEDLNLSDVHIGANGEFNQAEVAAAVKGSRKIIGDVVRNYRNIADGKAAIVFAVDKEHAEQITAAFNAEGVPAAFVHSDTLDHDRRTAMKEFKARNLRVLVNVDLFGEGVDVPAVEVVIMARPTASFSLFAQQIGRMLRLFISPVLMAAWDTFTVEQRLQYIAESPKPFGILIDHVGNVYREFNVGGVKYKGLPEGFTDWTLDRRNKRAARVSDDGIPTRICGSCHKKYERIYDSCPHCGAAAPEPVNRSSPEFVDGDLTKLDPAVLAVMTGEVRRIDGACYTPGGVPSHVAASIRKDHADRQREQHHLREAIAYWVAQYPQHSDSVNYKRFYHTFGIDVVTAKTLSSKDAIALRERVQSKTKTNLPALPPLPTL
jgi:superfamily II DNA or RNA helicase